MANVLTVGVAVFLSAVFAGMAMSAGSSQARPPREDYNSGAYLYRTFCTTCHSDSGRGDGPVADIADRRPSDLTVLARNHGGTYPRDRVMRVLENIPPVAGHEPPAMPNWRNVLRRTERDDERVVQKRLEALVDYVSTLQQK
ncbi:MAG TPA: cytochrome c [Vicinamibacterales bacterium]|nr:cytochrome c [Vicinamibacterales bacterium]